MSQPYYGEIRMFAGNFAPAGWFLCEGQLLPISENDTLFTLIGTTYGGDGETTFALPDLRGRLPLHMGSGFTLAETGGVEEVTLTVNQIPAHSHPLQASGDSASTLNPGGEVLATPLTATPFFGASSNLPLAPQAIASVGGSQPHTNFQPYLCVNFIIANNGIFPSQT
jgi:microcystin-dependent protein